MHYFSESPLKTKQMINIKTAYQKFCILTNFRVSEKWPNFRGAMKKVVQGLGGGKKQFLNL